MLQSYYSSWWILVSTDGTIEMTQNAVDEIDIRYEYRTSRWDILLADTID